MYIINYYLNSIKALFSMSLIANLFKVKTIFLSQDSNRKVIFCEIIIYVFIHHNNDVVRLL